MSATKIPTNPQQTPLWKSAFGPTSPYSAEIREYYSTHLAGLREKAIALIEQIKIDLPMLTVHDSTHLDALWELGSLISGTGATLNPAEAFVFGASVLLHDSAMCIAAYPKGLEDVKSTPEWLDVVTMLLRAKDEKTPSTKRLRNPPSDVFDAALPKVLRLLHAKQAEYLPKLIWKNMDTQQHLIDNIDLNGFYGALIGKMARSHGEPLSYIDENFAGILGAMPTHDGGLVNELKLALLLRCADAIHIDARRAPQFHKVLSKPTGISALHWSFQEKIAKPRVEKGELVFSSGAPFSLEEADAWWLCFDAVKAADKEIRDADNLLEISGHPRFAVSRVRGAESPHALAKDVKTYAWDPIDAAVKISDVRHIVDMFGGSSLYGDNPSAVIRELIQNSADAVRARRKRQTNDFWYEGQILIELKRSGDSWWLDVSDSGIGMSTHVMTEVLLDFGKSFWSSETVQREFPGLMASGLEPSGKFGIGFFSVFMLADVVSVTSRRYDRGYETSRTMEFRDGLNLRPIIRKVRAGEDVPEGGTRVSLKLKSPPFKKGGILSPDPPWNTSSMKLDLLVGSMIPNLDVTVVVISEGVKVEVVRANDWLTMTGANLLSRIHMRQDHAIAKQFGSMLRTIKDDSAIYGRACISGFFNQGVLAVKGFNTDSIKYIQGIILGEVVNLARDRGQLRIPTPALLNWAQEQVVLASESDMQSDTKIKIAAVALALGASVLDLPLLSYDDSYMNFSELSELIRNWDGTLNVFIGDPSFDDDDSCHPSEFRDFEPDEKTLFLADPIQGDWIPLQDARGKTLFDLVTEIIQSEWIDFEMNEIRVVIGRVRFHTIERNAYSFDRNEI